MTSDKPDAKVDFEDMMANLGVGAVVIVPGLVFMPSPCASCIWREYGNTLRRPRLGRKKGSLGGFRDPGPYIGRTGQEPGAWKVVWRAPGWIE